MATGSSPGLYRQDSTRSSSAYSSYVSMSTEYYRGAAHPTHFANVEDMLFEVFRCEETDTFDTIAIRQFLRVSEYVLGKKSSPPLRQVRQAGCQLAAGCRS